MTKNKLEKRLSKWFKSNHNNWVIKLHNNPLAHQNTPGDYLISTKDKKLILVEAKQVTCQESENGRFAFKRLKQKTDLQCFEYLRSDFHYSFVCLGFMESHLVKSEIYLIPIKFFVEYMDKCSKLSINRNEAKENFKDYQIDLSGACVL